MKQMYICETCGTDNIQLDTINQTKVCLNNECSMCGIETRIPNLSDVAYTQSYSFAPSALQGTSQTCEYYMNKLKEYFKTQNISEDSQIVKNVESALKESDILSLSKKEIKSIRGLFKNRNNK